MRWKVTAGLGNHANVLQEFLETIRTASAEYNTRAPFRPASEPWRLRCAAVELGGIALARSVIFSNDPTDTLSVIFLSDPIRLLDAHRTG